MSYDRTPPNDVRAEQAAIGLALSHGSMPEPLDTLEPGDFYQPVHITIWAVMQWLTSSGKPCDGVNVHAGLSVLGKDRQFAHALEVLPGLVSTVWGGTPETVTEVIMDRSKRRAMIDASERSLQECYTSADDYELIAYRLEVAMRKVMRRDTGQLDSLISLSELIGMDFPTPDWVIDGLLARGERLILTGTEGLGKSTLCRQLGACTAAGIEPFHGWSTTPRTVLVIDVENPPYILKKRYRELAQAIRNHGSAVDDELFRIDSHPEGLNLADGADRRWLLHRIRSVKPDLLVIGPAYKLHEMTNDDSHEVIARTVTSVLDDLRGDAAVVLEHHSGNEQAGQARPVRPFGSSVWRRWPEFGYGIRLSKVTSIKDAEADARRVVDLVPWRIARDTGRKWPRQMESGGDGLPWVETVVE